MGDREGTSAASRHHSAGSGGASAEIQALQKVEGSLSGGADVEVRRTGDDDADQPPVLIVEDA